jgi:hypothetical protein
MYVGDALNADFIAATIHALVTDRPSESLFAVADAVKRVWLLRNGQLRACQLVDVTLHATDLSGAAFLGLCRIEALRSGRSALRDFADAVNALYGKPLFAAGESLGAKDVLLGLTHISDAWYCRVEPGPVVAAYVAAAARTLPACAAVVAGVTAGDQPGWYDSENCLLLAAFEHLEAMCWGVLRSAYFLGVQAGADGATSQFHITPTERAAVIGVIVSKLLPATDPAGFGESAYQLYLNGSAQPGDCASYRRASGYDPCRVVEVMQHGRRAVFREAMLLLKCVPAAAVSNAGWPAGVAPATCRRLSQFAREVALMSAVSAYCTLRSLATAHVKTYLELELTGSGWWANGPDIAYPCIIRAGTFWVLVGAERRACGYTLDVIDAFAWLLAGLHDAGDSVVPLLRKLGLDPG